MFSHNPQDSMNITHSKNQMLLFNSCVLSGGADNTDWISTQIVNIIVSQAKENSRCNTCCNESHDCSYTTAADS